MPFFSGQSLLLSTTVLNDILDLVYHTYIPLLYYYHQVFHAITKLVLKTKKAATANAPQQKKDTTIKVGGNRGGAQKSKKCC